MFHRPIYLLRRFLRDIFNPIRYEVADGLNDKHLREYYFLFREEELVRYHKYQFDENNVPLTQTHADQGKKRYYYNPNFIGQHALAVYHSYIENRNQDIRERFLTLAQWFLHNYEVVQQDAVVWFTPVPVPKFNVSAPYISAMYQGRVASVLLRAYTLTQKTQYLDMARKAFGLFDVPLERGGVCSSYLGHPFYEEYPSEPPSHVLNGMIYALFGLYDLFRVSSDERAKQFFDRGVNSLIQLAEHYDLGYWTKYDLYDERKGPEHLNPATVHYHMMHIDQFRVLYRITNNEYFFELADKWDYYLTTENKIKAYILKLKRIT